MLEMLDGTPCRVTAGEPAVQQGSAMRRAILGAGFDHPGGFEVDLEGAAHVHAAALQVLVAATRDARKRGTEVRLVGVSESVVALLRSVGAGDLLQWRGGSSSEGRS